MTISHFSDQKALPKPHQEADERLHGFLAHRAEEDRGAEPRHTQCRDLQAAWQKVSCGVFSIYDLYTYKIYFTHIHVNIYNIYHTFKQTAVVFADMYKYNILVKISCGCFLNTWSILT